MRLDACTISGRCDRRDRCGCYRARPAPGGDPRAGRAREVKKPAVVLRVNPTPAPRSAERLAPAPHCRAMLATPSETRIWPVSQPPPGEHRNATSSAASCGQPTRPRGVPREGARRVPPTSTPGGRVKHAAEPRLRVHDHERPQGSHGLLGGGDNACGGGSVAEVVLAPRGKRALRDQLLRRIWRGPPGLGFAVRPVAGSGNRPAVSGK
jgi:hypothetical protein